MTSLPAGHSAWIEERGNGFYYAHCSCGYLGTRRRTKRLAAEAAVHHIRQLMRKRAADRPWEVTKHGDRD